ncbi:ATP-binding cassette sub-family C member 9-like [Asterias rubens]|uniref:ATP-binding cassette sub-family C member 9-like n=1 Tax=Asterias rubens TaxID=7604 RepID=UPI00145580E1|nr:ATP-binding cassette sub-family C member 9-like [Asterias rubens]
MGSKNKTDLLVPDWFCGGNSSLWEDDTDLQHVCHIDGLNSILQALFFIVFSLVLLLLKCCSHRQKWVTGYLQRYPLHVAQWILMFLAFLLHLFGLAEGCLTDQTFRTNTLGVVVPTQPHLYIPSICGLVMSILAMVYYHHIEVWQGVHMLWLFLVYWCFTLAGEIIHLLALIEVQLGSLTVLRFDLCVLSIAVYFCLIAIQVNNVRVKIFCSKLRASASYINRTPEAMKFAQKYSGFPSEVSYWWLNWLFRLGYKRPLEQADLGSLPEEHAASYVHNNFKKAYLREKDRARVANCQPSLWRVYWDVHGWRMVFAMVLKLSGEMCTYVGPMALNGIIIWVGRVREGSQEAHEPHFITVPEFFKHGLVLVGITFIVACIRTLLMQTYEYWCAVVGIHFRSSIQTMVFEKSLRISTFVISNGDMTMGQIANHMSTDAINIFYMVQFICWMVTVPIQIVVTMTLLVFQLGISALLGVVVFFFIVPVQIIFGHYMARLEKQALNFSDDRLKMSNEVLQGIKLLKMYGWEDLFGKAIEKIRRSEIWNVSKMMGSYGVIGSLTEAAPLMVTLVSFGTMLPLTGQILTPDVAFSSLALFNLLQDPLFLFPMTLFMTINGAISTARIGAFLAAPEVNMETLTAIETKKTHLDSQSNGRLENNGNCFSDEGLEVPLLKTTSDKLVDSVMSTSHESQSRGTYGSLLSSSSVEYGTCPHPPELPNHIAIQIENGSFTWDPESSQPILNDLNVTIPAGKLTMIVGTVGSGKSSFLSAILEEMTLQKGTIQINGSRKSIAYASQKAWLLNASLKENILFGQALNQRRYNRVISSCALQADIDILPAGDQTEIGEKGINISGGQKQRISVARAMYSDRDIILLDDPLSALDVHVGKHLFDNGIMNKLRKKKKTIVLVTHQLQYLSQADKILLMRDGAIAHEGTLEDIAAAEPDLYSGYETAVRRMTESEGETDKESRTHELIRIKRQISRQQSVIGEEQTAETCDERGSLISREEIERGSVSLKVYFFYAKAIGLPMALAILLLYPLQAGIIAGSNYWLSEWSNAGLTQGNATDSVYYIKVYAFISVAGMLNSFITTLSTVIGLVIAARKLFYLMLRNIIHMPMRFFDTTPLGRIINRFSADTQIIDMKLVLSFDTILFFLMAIVAALVINTIINPLFLAIILPLLVFYYMIQKIFITASRELQRLDSISKSPIFSFFSETLGGLSTIRAYRKQQSFFDDIVKRVSANNTPYLYLQTSLRWLAVRLDFVGALVVLIAGLTTVLGSIYGSVDSSLVGLGISYALMVSVYLQQLVRYMAEAEMQMNAVERVKHYTALTPESYEGIEPPYDWPSKGAISIQNISVRYAEELDAVLKDVSVEIEAGKKVGICGRTGSGKSSLTAALFRIIDTFKGCIIIDGVDIASVPLTTLRRRLAIIPQDPVLFDGTIRMNLDPEFKRSEEELWHALEISQLKNLVMQMDGGLDSQVSEGGENFSVGQRQLFCLARAFLRNAHILIMDEATASIDVETDRILQEVVATAFVNKTVLTIAHRVATILNSDVILTLSQGEVIENDTPENLLANPDSMFGSLVNSNQ